MVTANIDEQIKKQTDRLAATIKRQVEKNNAAAARATAAAAKKTALEVEKRRIAEKLAREEKKRVDAKRAHIFFRVMTEHPSYGLTWVIKALKAAGASAGVMSEFEEKDEKIVMEGVVSADAGGSGKSDEQSTDLKSQQE